MVAIVILAIALCGIDAAHAAPFAYVTNRVSDTVSVIDTATNTVVGLTATPIGETPTATVAPPAPAPTWRTEFPTPSQ